MRTVMACLCEAAGGDAFDERWLSAVEGYRCWEETSAGKHTSVLNRKLKLYQLLLVAFPNVELRNNPALLQVILSTVHQLGEIVTFQTSSGKTPTRIIRREITERLGVLVTSQALDGRVISHEFFD